MASALDRFWMPTTPALRLGTVRALVGAFALVYLLIRAPHLFSYALDDVDRFQPVGLATLAPSPTLPLVYQGLVALTLALAVPFFLGWKHRVLAPLFAGLLLWVLTYSNSWGKILHTDNALTFHVLILALAPAADALSLDARHRPTPPASGRYGWPLKLMGAVVVAVYLLAGIAKLRNGGFEFLGGETLRNFVAFGNVRKIELGSHHSPLGAWLSGYPAPFVALAGFSLLAELVAPLALFHRRFGVWWSVAIWGFHLGVLALMAIGFFYQLTFVAFLPFLRAERIWERRPFRRLGQRLGGAPRGDGAAQPEPVAA